MRSRAQAGLTIPVAVCIAFAPACTQHHGSNPPSGSAKETFGIDGRTTLAFPGEDEPADVALDSAGRIVVLGRHAIAGTPDFAGLLARFDASTGALDATFGSSGIVTFSDGASLDAGALAIDAAGRFIVVGGGNSLFAARLGPSGTLDATFGTGGTIHFSYPGAGANTYYRLRAVRILPGGSLIAAGGIYDNAGFLGVIERLTPEGLPDATFGTAGMLVFGDPLNDMHIDPLGRIVLADFSAHVMRRLPDGSPDPSFGASGSATLDSMGPAALALQADGGVVVGGTKDFRLAAARLTAGGALDASFGTGGISVFPVGAGTVAGGIAVDDVGRTLVSGYSFGLGVPDDVVRFQDDGSADAGFGIEGGIPAPCTHGSGYPGKVLVTPDRTIVYVAECATNGELDITLFGFNP